jgi:predicted AAA+ superfamily ATPase
MPDVVPDVVPDLERTLRTAVEKASASFRVVLLNGQRQVGKSTLLKNMAEGTGRSCVSLDSLTFRKLAREDPELFLQQNPPPVLIDEVQYAPELFPYIKIYADSRRDQKGAFWLTGSQKYKLMEGVGESLAGRIAILDLMGLSYREKIGAPFSGGPFLPSMQKQDMQKSDTEARSGEAMSAREVFRRIWEGSLPEPVIDENIDRETYYSSYVQSYIERDVRDFHNISKPIQFFDFVSAVAARTGTLLNYTSLAADIGIDVKTAQSWLGVMERSGLVCLLRPYSPNAGGRAVKTPKVYFLDTGLCSYLTRWTTPETLMTGAMAGAIFETYAVGEILKSYLHNGTEPRMSFYRDSNQNEIDVLLERDGTLYPIEIKKTANPGLNDYKSFALTEKLGRQPGLGAVVCLQPERIPLSREAVSIPVWEI